MYEDSDESTYDLIKNNVKVCEIYDDTYIVSKDRSFYGKD